MRREDPHYEISYKIVPFLEVKESFVSKICCYFSCTHNLERWKDTVRLILRSYYLNSRSNRQELECLPVYILTLREGGPQEYRCLLLASYPVLLHCSYHRLQYE